MKRSTLFLLPVILSSIASCGNGYAHHAFLNAPSFQEGPWYVHFTSVNENRSSFFGGYDLTFYAEITNNGSEKRELKLLDAKFIDESNSENNKSYTDPYPQMLNPGQMYRIGMSAWVGSSYKDKHYTFEFTIESKKVCYHLYNYY